MPDLRVGGFYVEHRRQVAATEQGVVDEIVGLFGSARAHRPEVVGTGADTLFAGLRVVVHVIQVSDACALRRLDVDERHGIVGCTADVMASPLADVGNAQTVPMDGVFLPSFAVLVAGDVDAVDAFRSVAHALTHKPIVAPFAHTQTRLPLGVRDRGQSEAVATPLFPVAFEIVVSCGCIRAVAFRFLLVEVASVGAGAVGTDARGERVVVAGAYNGAAQRVCGQGCACADMSFPPSHVPD